MKIADRFQSYNQDGRGSACVKFGVFLNLSSEEIVCLCVLSRQRDKLGSKGFEVRSVMKRLTL